MIRLRQIKKSFEDKSGINEVLRGIDLDVMEGEFVSIMGPSGAGKSLLLSILGMYDGAWQGEYYFLDQAIRRLEDLDSAVLTYAEVKAIASGNPLVIEKAQVDAELMRLTRLRSAHAEEQYRIRSNLRRSHEDAEMFAARLTNLHQDIAIRQDTSGDKFTIELDGQETNNRGIAGELILRRAEKLKDRFGDDV